MTNESTEVREPQECAPGTIWSLARVRLRLLVRWRTITVMAVAWAVLLGVSLLGSALPGSTARAQIRCPASLLRSPTPNPQPLLPPVGPGSGGPAQTCYPAGWNLVGGRVTFPVPLWIWDPVAGQYRHLPAGSQLPSGPQGETNGQGAWAFFPETTAVLVTNIFPYGASVSVPVASDTWQQIGDPFNEFQATICGPVEVFTYDPATGAYSQSVSFLRAGQGAWVIASKDTTVTLLPTGIGLECPAS